MEAFEEWRQCRFCKQSACVYRDGIYWLVKYSVRSYAHWKCLVAARGLEYASEHVPQHQQVQRFEYVITVGDAVGEPCSIDEVFAVFDLVDDAAHGIREARPGQTGSVTARDGVQLGFEVRWLAAELQP